MNKYSSSNLRLFTNNCPKALDMYEQGVPFDREFFQTGIAAHACIQTIVEKDARERDQQEKVCEAVCQELITKGRSYNDIPEPPMSPEDAFAGRDIALDYLMWNELPEEIVICEQGLGMTMQGDACDYDAPECRYRGILDIAYIDTIGDEEFQARVLVVRDWKSAWPTNETELETLQRKGQAVLAWLSHGDAVDGIRREVVNLRTGMAYSDDIFFDDEGLSKLSRWRDDILSTCNAADITRDARPGAGCLSCWYRAGCKFCLSAYADASMDAAMRYTAIEALRTEIAKPLRAAAKDSPIAIEGGEVGYCEMKKKIPTDQAVDKLLEYWTMDSDGDLLTISEVRGLLVALQLPASSFEKAAKVLFPERGSAAFDDMVSACVKTKSEARFGITKS